MDHSSSNFSRNVVEKIKLVMSNKRFKMCLTKLIMN